MAFSRDPHVIVAGGDSGVTCFVDPVSDPAALKLARGEPAARLPVLSVACSPVGRLAVSGSMDGTLSLWDVSTVWGARRPARVDSVELPGRDHATALAFTPDGRFVLAGTARGKVLRYGVK